MDDPELQLDPQRVIITRIDLPLDNYVSIVLKIFAAQVVIGLVFVLPIMCIYGALTNQ